MDSPFLLEVLPQVTDFLANVLADDAFTNTTSAAKDVVYTIVPVGDQWLSWKSIYSHCYN